MNGEEGTNWSCHASAILKVLAQKEGKEDHCREIEHTFNAKENEWGFPGIKSFRKLMDNQNGWFDWKTDSITLKVEITNADIPDGIEIEIPSKVPDNIMCNLFDKRDQFFDCLLISSDKIEIKAYKGILACRSPVFAGMFQHGMVEAQDGIVRIPDIRSEVLEQMLYFMYSGKQPNMENIGADELLMAAEKYELVKLKMFSERNLAYSLNNENACELLAFADLHSAKLLKANALKLIKENANEVTQTEGWKMLEQGIYGEELLNEIMKAINDPKKN